MIRHDGRKSLEYIYNFFNINLVYIRYPDLYLTSNPRKVLFTNGVEFWSMLLIKYV